MIQLKVTGIGEVQRTLYLLTDRLKHGREAWQLIGQYLRGRVVRDAFGGEQSFYGQAWKPLSDATLMARAYRQTRSARGRLKTNRGRQRSIVRALSGSAAKILQDTGTLRGSITAKADQHSVTVGSNVSYAKTHQLGSKKRHIPARPFLPTPESGLPPRDMTRIREILNRFYMAGEAR